MIDRFERFTLAISDISRSWHKIAASVMEVHGLKGPHALYLTTMIQHPDGLTAPQIGELCGRDKSDVSRTIAQLEEKGLAEKETTNQTRYGGRIRLTSQGVIAAEQVITQAKLAVEHASRGLSEGNRNIFYEALELIADNMREISQNGL